MLSSESRYIVGCGKPDPLFRTMPQGIGLGTALSFAQAVYRMSAPALASRFYSASTARRVFNGAPLWSIAVLLGVVALVLAPLVSC